MSHFLGIDVSTTATKALVADPQGRVLAVGRSTYTFDSPRPLWAEQSPLLWWDATVEAIEHALDAADIAPADVSGIGLTGQMHGLVLLDARGDVVRPAILWNDQRTQDACDEIRRRIGRKHLIEVTGNDALTGFTAPKILWVREHEPDRYARIDRVLLPKDYVRFRLTGEYAVDRAGGSGTILFDLARRDWSDEIVDGLEIPRGWLPPTFEGPEVTGGVSESVSGLTGIPAGTQVYGGAGDQAANAVGVGAVVPGSVAMSIGTSGVVFAPTSEPLPEPEGRLHAFCHAAPELWHLMGVMLSAAGSLEWFRNAFAPDTTFPELDAAAAAVDVGSNGLLFLPYLSGERTPYPDPLARGAFVGLTVRHTRAHLARAVMEGVAFGLKDAAELVAAVAPVEEIRASGGGASSEIWRQVVADVLDLPVTVAGTSEGAAHGAALIAATGAGAFSSIAEASSVAVEVGSTTEPTGAAGVYGDVYDLYRAQYPLLSETFVELARFDT